ncbi:MAG: hypothetical protein IPM97_11540 [Bdellovibrionaceae bacterium]|nr:hypothetical protein [Pseudobdellovibrionaceae bacterium]
MQNLILQSLSYNGREGLSRSLTSHLSGQAIYFMAWLATISIGSLLAIDVFSHVLKGHFYYLLRFTSLFEILLFATFLTLSIILRETIGIRVHLHGDRFYFENKEKPASQILLSDVIRLRFARHKKVVPGFYLELSTGESIHIPIFLERVDYILDSLKFYRPDLCTGEDFMRARRTGVIVDHLASHHKEWLAQSYFGGIGFFLVLPFLLRREYAQAVKDPSVVMRDRKYKETLRSQTRHLFWWGAIMTFALSVYFLIRR